MAIYCRFKFFIECFRNIGIISINIIDIVRIIYINKVPTDNKESNALLIPKLT